MFVEQAYLAGYFVGYVLTAPKLVVLIRNKSIGRLIQILLIWQIVLLLWPVTIVFLMKGKK